VDDEVTAEKQEATQSHKFNI